MTSWSQLKEKLLAGTSVRLDADIAQSSDAVSFENNQIVTIDLNGHTLTRHASYRLFKLNSTDCELTLDDTSASGAGQMTCTDKFNGDGGLVMVEKGHLILTNGTFTGKATGQGGFAYVKSGGRVTMNGGTISATDADGDGGAFYVNGGTVTMNDGTISSCRTSWHGGAMRLYNAGTVTVNGGRITGCTSDQTGKLLYLDDSNVTLNGGVFEDCDFYNMSGSGGSIRVKGGVYDKSRFNGSWRRDVTFENSEYSFTGSDSATHYLVGRDASFTDGKLSAGTFTFDPSDPVYAAAGLKLAPRHYSQANGDGTYTVVSGLVSVTSWSQLKEKLLAGTSVRLDADIAQDSDTVYFEGNQIVTIDLNGHTLTSRKNFRFIDLNSSGCEVTIDDTSASGAGKVTCTDKLQANGGLIRVQKGHLVLENGTFTGKTTGQGGFAFVDQEGRVTMNSGTIAESTSYSDGGAFYVNGGTVTLNGGTISSCQSTDYYGGAMRLYNNSTVILNAGLVTNCSCGKEGAAFYVQNSTLTMNGGTISKCSATSEGGAFRVFSGSVTVNSGLISECSAKYAGAASIYSGSLTVNGGTFTGCTASGDYGATFDVDTSSTVTINGGVFEKTGENGFYISDSSGKIRVNGGVFDCSRSDTSKWTGYGTITFENSEYPFTGSDAATHYLVGRDAAVSSAGILTAGTFTFNPRETDYVDAGLLIPVYATVTPNADATYTVAVTDPVVAETWETVREALASGLNVTLGADITAEGKIELKEDCAGKDLVLDLNGHAITHTATADRFLTLSPEAANCVLTILDSSETQTGAIVHTGGAVTTNGGCAFVDAGTSLVLKGGLIAGFASTDEGAAFAIGEDGSFTFQAGVISNCTSSAVANHGTTLLAGGLVDDASITNEANGVTFETDCSLVGTGKGMYVIGRDPIFSTGLLVSGTFFFDPAAPLYSASGLVLADFVWTVGLRDGTWRVDHTVDSDSVVQNGSFERGTALPPEGEAGLVAESSIVLWTGGDGATVFTAGWAATNGLSVLDGKYAVVLSPGATITQQVAVALTGSYHLTVGYSGDPGAIMSAEFDERQRETVVMEADVWRMASASFSFDYAKTCLLVLSNASQTANCRLAIDRISLTYAGVSPSVPEELRLVNGGFEEGTSLPTTDSSSDLDAAGVTGWNGSTGAGVFGADATNAWPCGVSEGRYALYLENHASVMQDVPCAEEDARLVINAETGRYYSVSYVCAARQAGERPCLLAKLLASDGTVRDIASTVLPEDGSWTSVSTLVFLPAGNNAIFFVNDSNSGCAVVDNVKCVPYVHPIGDVIFNGGFEYGAGLPGLTGYDYAKPRGQAEPSVWCVTNAAGVFGARALSMTRAGTFFGRYGLFLQNGGRAVQDFLVPTAGTYRVAFAIAERLMASGDGHPTVAVSIDGEARGTFTAYSSKRYDPQILFCDLEAGQHTIAFEASALLEQAILLDAVSVRLKRDVTPIPDITGVTPSVRIVPTASAETLLAQGAELSCSEIDTDEFKAEDFVQGATNDFFRLERHIGAYAHPEYVLHEPLQLLDGFATSVGGIPRGGNGPILSFEMQAEAVSDTSSVFSFESRSDGQMLAFVVAPIENGVRGAPTELFTFPMTNAVRRGAANLAVSWNDGRFGFYVNGLSVGSVAFMPDSTFLFKRLRLGAYPESTETNAIADRAGADFDLSDVRVYAQGLTAEQVALLSDNVRGTSVDVTLYDATTDSAYGTHSRRVGGVYGPLAVLSARRDGYVFLGWKLSSDGKGDFVSADTLVATSADHRLYAQWSNIVYRVTYDFDGYPFAENRTQEILAGEAYNLPTGFEVNGATFHDWTNRYGQVISAGAVFPVSGVYADETLYCSYENAYGTLTFEPHNGAAATVTNDVRVGSPVLDAAPEDPLRGGYAFAGWFDAEKGGAQATDATLFANVDGETWHAHWSGEEQTVTWRAEGCTVPVQTTVSRSGEPYVLPDPVANTNETRDVRFYGWGREVEGTFEVIAVWDYATDGWSTNTAVTTWTNAHDAVALWWTACAFDPAGGTVASEKTYLRPGETYGAWAALPTPARTGYTFDGWATNATAGAAVTDTTPVEDPAPTNLVARWHALAVKVMLDANGGTSTVESVLVNYDGPYGAFPTPTRPGYALDSWHYVIEDGAVITPETIVSNPDDHTVVASWTNAWYVMRYSVNGKHLDGRDFCQRYENPWQNLYVPTQAELGEHGVFRGWMLAETHEVVAEGETATMTCDGDLFALIEGETCTITLDAVDGILDADRRTLELEYQAEVEGLPEPPDIRRANCTFLGWYTQDGLLVTNGMLWVVSGTTALQAKWLGTVAHTVTYERNMTVSPSIEACHDLCYGEQMPIVLKPDRSDGAKFLGWYFGETPCTDAEGNPLEDCKTCPWETDVTLKARWTMPRDFFARAESLESGVTNTVVGVFASDEPDEPNHDAAGDLRATHWYRFQGTSGTAVRLAFEDLTGLEPCVQLVVYAGTSLTELVKKTALLELDETTTVLEWTPDATDTYYLALAQGREQDGDAGLSSYRISATGVSAPKWTSAWTNPSTMPGETELERNNAALLNDGFTAAVSARVAPKNAYSAFTKWAGVGNESTEIPPEYINDKANAVLASAYNLKSAPTGTVSIVACERTTSGTGASVMRLTLQVSGDFSAGGANDMYLLAAALGVKGSTSLDGTYSTDTFDCTVEAVDKTANTVRLLVTPKDVLGEKPPQFFFMGATY